MRNLSYIELNSNNLLHNLNEFKKSYKGKIAAVVKGNAYGHGLKEVVTLLEKHVDYFQVDDFEEFKALRHITEKPALVLGYLLEEELEPVVTQNGIAGLYSKTHISTLNSIGKKLSRAVAFHLKVDCLLGRQGILINDLPEMLTRVKRNKYAKLEGMYTHFSNIEDTSDLSHANKQVGLFKKALEIAKSQGFHDLETHINSTSGLLVRDLLNFQTSISRLGIGLYGMWPSENLRNRYGNKLKLKPVIKWSTHVAQVKTVPKNYPIGYGLTYITPKKLKVAVIPQGYSDGYDRGLSNIGSVLIKGLRCPILGRVAMNMFVVNVDHVTGIEQGEPVVLLGTQDSNQITAEEVAQSINTINYEITTRISPLLPRVVVKV